MDRQTGGEGAREPGGPAEAARLAGARAGQQPVELAQALCPPGLHPVRGLAVRKLPVLDRDLALGLTLGDKVPLDAGAVGPGDAHGLVGHRRANGEAHVTQPAAPSARVPECAIDPSGRRAEGLALPRLVLAVSALTHGSQPLDALVADGDRLGPPHRRLVATADMIRDRAVGPILRAGLVEHPDPALPVATGAGLDR